MKSAGAQLLEAPAQRLHLAQGLLLLQRALDADLEARGVQRLLDEVVGALADRRHRGVDGAAAGEEDDRAVRQLLLQRAQQPQPVGLGHRQVREDHVRPELGRLPQGVVPVDRGLHLVAPERPASPPAPRRCRVSSSTARIRALPKVVSSPLFYGSGRPRARHGKRAAAAALGRGTRRRTARRAAASACSTSVSSPSSRPPSCTWNTTRAPSFRTERRTCPSSGVALECPEHRDEDQEGERRCVHRLHRSLTLGHVDHHPHPRPAPAWPSTATASFTIAERESTAGALGEGARKRANSPQHRVHPRTCSRMALRFFACAGGNLAARGPGSFS